MENAERRRDSLEDLRPILINSESKSEAKFSCRPAVTRPVEKHMHCQSYDNDFSYGFFTGVVSEALVVQSHTVRSSARACAQLVLTATDTAPVTQ